MMTKNIVTFFDMHIGTQRKCENPSRDRVSGLSSQDETETVMLLNWLFPRDCWKKVEIFFQFSFLSI